MPAAILSGLFRKGEKAMGADSKKGKITVVGIGPGEIDQMTLEAYQCD